MPGQELPDGTRVRFKDGSIVYEVRNQIGNIVQLWKGDKFITYANVKSLVKV